MQFFQTGNALNRTGSGYISITNDAKDLILRPYITPRQVDNFCTTGSEVRKPEVVHTKIKSPFFYLSKLKNFYLGEPSQVIWRPFCVQIFKSHFLKAKPLICAVRLLKIAYV